MKFAKKLLALAASLLMLAGSMPVSAITPYSTYTYDIDGSYMESPHAYVPQTVIDSESLGLLVPISAPKDFFVHEYVNEAGETDYTICISDTGNKRVIIVDSDFKVTGIIMDFENEWGVPDQIAEPTGLFVDVRNHLYVCDTSNNRILVFDLNNPEYDEETGLFDYNFVKTYGEPEGDVFAEGTTFKPVAVAVDDSGRIYTVSSASYQGIIAMTSDGVFQAFLGAQSNTLSAWEIIWRRLQTAEQRNKSAKNVSTEYNNLNIDSGGFIYATTDAISESDQLQAIQSKSRSGDYAPVKMLNPSGQDVMMRTGFYPPSGEVTVQTYKTTVSDITGPSKIIDVALGPDDEGVWTIVDSVRQKFYTYDDEGRLLYIFGDKGDQLGNIQTIAAVDYLGTSILALDTTSNNITVYKRTEYGDLLAQALKNNKQRLYDEAQNDWTNILQRNSNFDMSYVGIGQCYYREGEWEKAMDMYKYAYDTENYSDAYHELRKESLSKVIILVPIAIIIICILLSIFLKYAAKKNAEGQSSSVKRTLWREYLYGYYVIFHPFDGFWDIKHEKRATTKGATLIFGLTVIAFFYQSIGRGYIVNPEENSSNFLLVAISLILPVGLWIIANWCLTTLFDGEGSLKDIYIATCYSLFPLPFFIIVTTFASNFITLDEVSVINLMMGIAYFWVGFLLFFGMMTIHDYSLGKNVLTSLGSIVGMAFIMFIAVLFSSLIGKIISFVFSVVLELSYRMS